MAVLIEGNSETDLLVCQYDCYCNWYLIDLYVAY